MVFFTAEERRGDIFMNTLNMSLGSSSVASSELIFWSGVLRGHYQEFPLCAKGIFDPLKYNCLYCCSFKELPLMVVKGCMCILPCEHIHGWGNGGDSISIVLGISGAKPRHRKALQRIKDSSSALPLLLRLS